MGSWSHATYVNHGDLDVVAQALTALFAKEDMHPTPRPPERTELIYEPMQYGRAEQSDLWAVALLPGRENWTIVRTAPLSLLCERAKGAAPIRLAALAESLDCSAVTYNLHNTAQGMLIEALRTGEYALSGFIENPNPNRPTMDYYDEPYGSDAHCQEYFRLLAQNGIAHPEASDGSRRVIEALAENPYPDHRRSPSQEQITAALADALGGPNAEGGDNYIIVNKLIRNKDLHIYGGRALYFARK